MAIAERELTAPDRKKTWQSEPEASEEFTPHPYRWTREQFYAMGDAGLFEGRRAILVEGEILAMPAMGDLHRGVVTLTDDVLRGVFGEGFFFSVQCPFDIGEATDPEPDVAVIAGTIRDFISRGLTEAVLIVEVSDTTLAYDRLQKASLYAKAGVADYWIVNVKARQIEVHRQPVEDAAQPFGFGYAEVTVHGSEAVVQPLAAPRVVAVAALLP